MLRPSPINKRLILDNQLRLQYLEAIGIDVWLPRERKADEHFLLLDNTSNNSNPETDPSLINNHWNELQTQISSCTQCNLCTTRIQTVFGSGNTHADWMFVGEAPGQHEEEQSLPFVGNSGLLFTEMLSAIGLTREEIFITNIIKCRPPDNREPHADEIRSCKNYLQRQQQLINPKIIVVLGHVSAQTLLETDKPLSDLRGKVGFFMNTPVIVTYHPAYLLRFLPEKHKAWLDLTYAIQTFKNIKG